MILGDIRNQKMLRKQDQKKKESDSVSRKCQTCVQIITSSQLLIRAVMVCSNGFRNMLFRFDPILALSPGFLSDNFAGVTANLKILTNGTTMTMYDYN
jgi:hypothetical protein